MQTLQYETIPVIYKGNTYQVNTNQLCQSSKRFYQLLKTYIEHGEQSQPRLEILGENFSERNISNFLKICQNIPADVQNSEMMEICEIALMFEADEIYKKGINFIKQNIDSNFSIPEDKYNEKTISQHLQLTSSDKLIHHLSNFSDLEFENSEESSHSEENIKNNTSMQSQQQPTSDNSTVIYQIKEELLSRGQKFLFIKDNKAIYSSKTKGKNIILYRADSNDKSNLTIERSANLTIKINIDGKQIFIKFVLGKNTHFSMDVSSQNDSNINWIPQEIDLKTNSSDYKQLISGAFNHSFKKSNKNMALKDVNGNTKFIVRKVSHHLFEAECNSNIPDIIAFAIAVSQIVGPYFETDYSLSCGQVIMPAITLAAA